MKNKNKKILETIIDMYGYATGVAIAIPMLVLLNDIRKYGIGQAIHTTGNFILWLEILAVGGSIPFFIYKFFRSMINREKISQLLTREKLLN